MPKKQAPEQAPGSMMPDEINAVKALVKEFIGKMSELDREIELLGEDKKELIEEYSEKLDYKTLQLAMRVIKIQNSVQRRDAFDLFVEVLQDPAA